MQSTCLYSIILTLVATVRCNEFYAVSKISADIENILRNISDVTMTSCQMECMRDSKCKTIGLTTSKTKENDVSLYICHLLEKVYADGNAKGSNLEILQVKKLEPKVVSKWKRITFIPACKERKIEQKLLATLKKITRQYTVHAEIKPTVLAVQNEYLTSFHFTNLTGGNSFGVCIPKLLASGGKIHVCNALNDRPRVYVERPLEINKWLTVTISQIKNGTGFYQSVAFDGIEASSVINTLPTVFYNVNVYLGNIFGEAPQPGYIRNFWIEVENS